MPNTTSDTAVIVGLSQDKKVLSFSYELGKNTPKKTISMFNIVFYKQKNTSYKMKEKKPKPKMSPIFAFAKKIGKLK